MSSPAEERIKDITDWLRLNPMLLVATKRTKIEINLKGKEVGGSITSYPEDLEKMI